MSATVSVIDTTSKQVIATIPVGLFPFGVAVSSDGRKAYIGNQQSNTVSVIDTRTQEVIKTLVTGDGSFFSAINPAGTKFYVSNSNDTTVSVVDIASLTVLDVIPDVGSYPFDMAFGP